MAIKNISLLILLAVFNCSSAFAAISLDYPMGQKKGSFNCTASDATALVNIDTHGVDAQGFCQSSPYVSRDGHIAGLPVSQLNQYYFQIEKPASRTGSVSINVSHGDITCSLGHGTKSKAFAEGARFCLMNN
jgi:hypothetical protein